MPDNQKDWSTSVLPLMYSYNVYVHQATELPEFSLAITRVPLRPVGIPPLMPPDVGKIDSLLTYILQVFRRVASQKPWQTQIPEKCKSDARGISKHMLSLSHDLQRATTFSLNASHERHLLPIACTSTNIPIFFDDAMKLTESLVQDLGTPRSTNTAFEKPYQ